MIESFIIYDRLGCLKDEKGAWSSAMFLEFWKRAKIMVDFNRRVNLEACHLYFFSRFFGVDKLDKFHKFGRKSPEIDGTFFKYHPRGANIFVFFPTLAITVRVIKVMISGIVLDRLAGSHAGVFRGASVGDYLSSDRLRRLRSFPYDRFKIYTVVQIVQIELSYILSMGSRSSQSYGSFAIIWVVFQLRSSLSSHHYLRSLGQSRRSGLSYGKQRGLKYKQNVKIK